MTCLFSLQHRQHFPFPFADASTHSNHRSIHNSQFSFTWLNWMNSCAFSLAILWRWHTNSQRWPQTAMRTIAIKFWSWKCVKKIWLFTFRIGRNGMFSGCNDIVRNIFFAIAHAIERKREQASATEDSASCSCWTHDFGIRCGSDEQIVCDNALYLYIYILYNKYFDSVPLNTNMNALMPQMPPFESLMIWFLIVSERRQQLPLLLRILSDKKNKLLLSNISFLLGLCSDHPIFLRAAESAINVRRL